MRSGKFRFGPYLQKFSIEPFTKLELVKVDSGASETLIEFKLKMANDSTAKGGWLYQAKTGFVIANLNRKFFKEYYAFY